MESAGLMECYRSFTIKKIEHTTRSTMFPHLKIILNLSIQTMFRNYSSIPPPSRTGPKSVRALLDEVSDALASVSITFRTSFSNDDLQEAMEGAVDQAVKEAGLLPGDRDRLVERLRWKLGKRFRGGEALKKYKYTILYVDFEVVVMHKHVNYLFGRRCRPCPSTIVDSAAAAAMECEVDGARAEAERCCSICLEELGGAAAAARMPCKHVFHGGCIKEWLTKSHHCPLCRYQMPVA